VDLRERERERENNRNVEKKSFLRKELRKMYSSSNVVSVFKYRMIQEGHVAHIGKMRRNTSVGKPGAKKPYGRPTCR
jgi:hypothetical protein